MAIELIRALYDSNTPIPETEEYYQKAIEDIEFFEISSQIYHLLKESGKLEETPAFFQKRLKQKYTEALYQNLFIKNQTEMLLSEFEKLAIGVIPLKGVVFAEKYFGSIGARVTSDIDLLIKEDELDRAIKCVKNLGFTPDSKDIPSGFNLSFNKGLPKSSIPLMIELHWNIVDPTTADLNIEEFWNRSKRYQDLNYVKELSDFHTFYMIVLHGWRHNMNSLKYFIDILQLLFILESLNVSDLLQTGTKDKTLKRIVRTLSVVHNMFPHLEDLNKLPFKRNIMLWDSSNAKSVKKYIDFLDYQFLSYDSFVHSFIEFSRWIFPNTSVLRVELNNQIHNEKYIYLYLYRKRFINFFRTILRN